MRSKTFYLVGFLLLVLAHIGAFLIFVTLLASEKSTGQSDKHNEDFRRPKTVFNQKRLFHFLSKAASLEPLHPSNESCLILKR